MKIAEILSSDFLKKVNERDPEMYVFFQDTDIDDNNRARVESLRDSAEARDNFLQKTARNLFQVFPDRFTSALLTKDNLIMAATMKHSY